MTANGRLGDPGARVLRHVVMVLEHRQGKSNSMVLMEGTNVVENTKNMILVMTNHAEASLVIVAPLGVDILKITDTTTAYFSL